MRDRLGIAIPLTGETAKAWMPDSVAKIRHYCWIRLLVASLASSISTLGAADVVLDKIARIKDLKRQCLVVSDLPNTVGDSCFRRLDDYFDAEPIWNTANLVIHDQFTTRLHVPVFNGRSLSLPYTATDLAIDDVPKWRDVFDGRVVERLEIVRSVFADETCRQLESKGAIQEVYSTRCHARELFKYASFLDSCITGFDRRSFLYVLLGQQPVPLYQRARERTDLSRDVDEWEGNGWRLLEKYLQTIWIVEKCASLSFDLIGDPANPNEDTAGDGSFQQLIEALRPTHDMSMSIAARAGDPLAIQAFHTEVIHTDHEYWKSLRDLNPSLFHRWMARIVYRKDDRKNNALHALKSYRVELQITPSLDLDAYLSNFGITRNDFDVPAETVESLLEDIDWEATLKYPWNIED